MITRKAVKIAAFGMILTALIGIASCTYASTNPLNDVVNQLKETYTNQEGNISSGNKTIFNIVEELESKKEEEKLEKEEVVVKVEKSVAEPKEEKIIQNKSQKDNLESKIKTQNDYSTYKRCIFMGDVKPGEKVAYLTFDDGPSENTLEILEILKKYEIKATFFVNYRKGAEDIYNKISSSGNSVGNHTETHDYSSIYSSLEDFITDFKKMEKIIYDNTGKKSKIVRLPGGTNNTVSRKYGGKFIMYEIVDWLNEGGYKFFDWNAYALDAERNPLSKEEMVNNVFKDNKNKNVMLILMHDSKSKKKTIEVLPSIIEELIARDYEFRALDRNSYTVQFYQNPNFKYN